MYLLPADVRDLIGKICTKKIFKIHTKASAMEYFFNKFACLTKITYKGFPHRNQPQNFEFPEQLLYRGCKNDFSLWS